MDLFEFVAISVSRQSVSCWYRGVNFRIRCISIHLIFSKVSIVDFNGRRDIWLCPNIFWAQGWGLMDVLFRFGFSGRTP
jgi:hypothetical protein